MMHRVFADELYSCYMNVEMSALKLPGDILFS